MQHSGRVSVAVDKAAVSRYTWRETEKIFRYGSLFLHHLRLEGRPLYESPNDVGVLKRMLNSIGDYTFADRDILGFQQFLEDVSESLDSETLEVYEFAVLGTLIRHASILGCWLLGKPEFGRYEAVNKFIRARGIHNNIAKNFADLYQYRLYSENRVNKPRVCTVSLTEWLGRANQVVRSLSELANE